MGNLDLIYAAKQDRASPPTAIPPSACRGRCRAVLQPNHTTDDPEGITASTAGGTDLRRGGCGASASTRWTDSLEQRAAGCWSVFRRSRSRWQIPTQICVLAHVTTQMEAVKAGRALRPDLPVHRGQPEGQRGLRLLRRERMEEARQLLLQQGTAEGPNVMYFETGQGSELSPPRPTTAPTR